VDANQPDVVKALRKIGAEVTHMHQLGGGISDLLVSFRQRWYVMEVKSDDGELNADQKVWIGKQRAPVYTVRSAEQAVEFLTRETPDWLLGLTAQTMSRQHVCEGPNGDDGPMAEEIKETRESLKDRVLESLRTSWRSHIKLCENDLCERLGASKASKRVEKALRALCREGLAQREGNNRRAMYWAEEKK
jgi:hypothetical protein